MSHENEQVADTIMTDEELELELELDGNEDTEALKAELEKKNKIIKQVLARAKKAEAKAKGESPKINNQQEQRPSLSIDDETLDLRLDGYTRDEVEFIARNGGRKALEDKNSYVAIALNTKREQERAERAASQTADTSGMSEFERKYTPEMLANMSVAELEKIVPKA